MSVPDPVFFRPAKTPCRPVPKADGAPRRLDYHNPKPIPSPRADSLEVPIQRNLPPLPETMENVNKKDTHETVPVPFSRTVIVKKVK